jgi:hypothetical protein
MTQKAFSGRITDKKRIVNAIKKDNKQRKIKWHSLSAVSRG